MSIELLRDTVWMRRGCSLLWDERALAQIVKQASEVQSMRTLFAMAQDWPQELPSNDGQTLVVAGVEGYLDLLSNADGQTWLAEDLRNVLLRFQTEYDSQAALILWLPSGRERITSEGVAKTQYIWDKNRNKKGNLAIDQGVWGGAASDVQRIIFPSDVDLKKDVLDGIKHPACVGLYHPRIS